MNPGENQALALKIQGLFSFALFRNSDGRLHLPVDLVADVFGHRRPGRVPQQGLGVLDARGLAHMGGRSGAQVAELGTLLGDLQQSDCAAWPWSASGRFR